MAPARNTPESQANLQCPACGEAVLRTWKVCPACEAPLGRLMCPGCGMAVRENWKVCPECARRLTCATCGKRIPRGQLECPDCRIDKTGLAKEKSVFIEPVTGMEFVFVAGGTFQMGDLFGDGWDNESPVRKVCVESLYLAKYPATQGEWEKVMPENPAMFKRGPKYPVEQVSWADVQAFIRRLNERSTGGEFRLPTEAEWEYAARSGGRRELYAGGDDVGAVAWYAENSQGSTQPVGMKAANGLGLHDMSGNVWEWCQDVYIPGTVAAVSQPRPAARKDVTERVIRGGSWSLDDWSSRCSRRFGFPEDYSGAGLGFRLAMTPHNEPSS